MSGNQSFTYRLPVHENWVEIVVFTLCVWPRPLNHAWAYISTNVKHWDSIEVQRCKSIIPAVKCLDPFYKNRVVNLQRKRS